MASVSLEQVGDSDKQVAGDSLHSHIILKMVGEQSGGKRVQLGYIRIHQPSGTADVCSLVSGLMHVLVAYPVTHS